MIKTYSELMQLSTFMDRYEYLKLDGRVGEETFGFDRWINQMFYTDQEWIRIRNHIILRDNGCDLAILDREIYGSIFIHHINPISKDDILNRSSILLDPEFLICTSKTTHNAIHYGDQNLLIKDVIERSKNDTCLWKH